MNLKQLYLQGQAKLNQVKKDEDAKKLGVLRAGNSGCLLADGSVIGNCHRTAFLRSLGIEMPIEESTLLMFEGGVTNEASWLAALGAGLPVGYTLKAEADIPIAWETGNGTKVTGRPDLVVIGPAGSPTLGIELKQTSSVWTYRDCIIGGKPKTAHLAQALHYMWQLGIPYKLAYTARCMFAVDGGYVNEKSGKRSGWMWKNFPSKGELGSEMCDYNDKGLIKNVKPAMCVYDLRINSRGVLEFKNEQEPTQWATTQLDVPGLEGYYNAVASIAHDNDLGPRISSRDCFGEKANYEVCTYCEFKSVCESSEKLGVEAWATAAP